VVYEYYLLSFSAYPIGRLAESVENPVTCIGIVYGCYRRFKFLAAANHWVKCSARVPNFGGLHMGHDSRTISSMIGPTAACGFKRHCIWYVLIILWLSFIYSQCIMWIVMESTGCPCDLYAASFFV